MKEVTAAQIKKISEFTDHVLVRVHGVCWQLSLITILLGAPIDNSQVYYFLVTKYLCKL